MTAQTSGNVRTEPEMGPQAERPENGAVTNVRQLVDGGSEVPGVSAGEILGYARVSRTDQNLDRQLDALRAAGCTRIFTDEGVSGARASRPGLDELLVYLRPSDVVICVSLDRLGRRFSELGRLLETWREQGIGLKVLNLGIDTNTPAGFLLYALSAAIAENERLVLVERTLDGLAAARRRGRHGGRPPALTPEQRREAKRMRSESRSLNEIAAILGCSERTIRRVLSDAK